MNLRMKASKKITSLSVLVALLMASNANAQQEEILLVVSVARHGARSPQTVMPFNKTEDQFKNTSELLYTGFAQHKYIGSQLRERYINEFKLLNPIYDSSQIYVQATDKLRT